MIDSTCCRLCYTSCFKYQGPSEWTRLRYSFAIVLVTSELILISPRAIHFRLDRKMELKAKLAQIHQEIHAGPIN